MPRTDLPALAAAELAALADEYWRDFLAAHPVFATVVGDRRFDDRLDDISAEGLRADRTRLSGLLDRARAIPVERLGPTDRVTRSELIGQLERDIVAIVSDVQHALSEPVVSGFHEWTVDPLQGPQVTLMNIATIQPVATPDEGRAMTRRWREIGSYIDTHIDNLRRGLAAGKVAVREPVERVIDQLNDLLARADDAWPLLDPLAVEHLDWSEGERAEFKAGLSGSVREVARPAFERYRALLEAEILPSTRPQDRAGIMHIPGGHDAYATLIRIHTSLDLAPEELHETGLREVERINAETEALGARVLGAADRSETIHRLRTDPELYFRTRDEVSQTASTALERANGSIPSWFGILPRAGCTVVRMGHHEEKHSTIAYYREPAADGSRPGQYYINTSEPDTRPRYEAEALAYHESVPGHHLQIAIAQELTSLPAFRRHLGVTAYVEGWGLYTERLADEMGLYSGDLDRLGILSFDAWRACRLVVDTGMHALGWSRRQAIEFMVANTALAENNIVNEIDRYIVWPGQALAYKTGQLELLRLRAAARDQSGDRFDIRSFHDVVLGSGAVALSTLRLIVDDWIRSQGA